MDTSAKTPRRATRSLVQLATVVAILTTVSGCRFNVAVLRTILGDPLVTSQFESRTTVDLADSEKRLLVLCTASHAVTGDEPALPIDLAAGVSSRLNLHGINVVNGDDVARWIDENGSWDDLSALGQEFKADYIAVVSLDKLTYREPNSNNLFRADAKGMLTIHELHQLGPDKITRAVERYRSPVNEQYPSSAPISSDLSSEAIFRKQALDHVCTVIARHFHDYHPRDTI